MFSIDAPSQRHRRKPAAAILEPMRLHVTVQEDHLASLVRSPLDGLTELIWNSLDADADYVEVVYERNALGGIDAVRVEDKGHGMTPDEISAAFDRLGGSWKLRADRSKTKGRSLHGKRGQGRWRALGIGGARITWDTVANVDGRRMRSQIEIRRDSMSDAEVSAPEETDRPTGTAATVDGISEEAPSLVADDTPLRLTARFALHLLKYPAVTVRVDGHTLDAQAFVDSVTDVPMETDGAMLTVIEWKRSIKDKTLYLCDSEGVALHEIAANVPTPGINYSAYLKSDLIRQMEDRLLVAGFEQEELSPLIEEARDAIRRHFEQRAAERARDVIQNWRNEHVYPFAEPPRDEVETVKRQLFDVVAYTASPAVNATKDPRSKRLSLRLLEQALENEPAELRHILEEVLKLPKEQIDQLDELLQHTALTSIVTASSRIANRLKFVAGLEYVLFDPVMKEEVKERSQLHKLLAAEPWIFGEEYALAVSDRRLDEVLAQHLHILGGEVTANEAPVLDAEGKVRIIDLMFAGSMKQARQRREHLVVELKRPNVKIGADELTQIAEYAVAVAADSRFNIREVDWDFWVVSDELNAFAKEMTNKEGLPQGMYHRSKDGSLRVWAIPWAELIENANHRLKFVQEQLQYMVSGEDAIAYLRDAYEQFLPPLPDHA